MNMQSGRLTSDSGTRAKLVSGGRLQIPAEIRHRLGLKDGDNVLMKLEGSVLTIRSFRDILQQAREKLRPSRLPERGSYVDDFLAERRMEAERE